MKNDYLISIMGSQIIDNEEDKIELTALGSYIIKNNTHYILYNEYPEDPLVPAKNKITSILKVNGNKKVTIIRNNKERTRLVLEKNKRHQCYYATEFGSMMVGVFTEKINSKLTNKGGTLEVFYSLDVNSGVTSFNKIFVKIKELNEKDVKCDEAIN